LSAGVYSNPIDLFRAAISAKGIAEPFHIEADGVIHRYHCEGDRPGKKDGWYVLHLDGIPAGSFGHWNEGIPHTWCAKSKSQMTPAERAEHLRRMDETRRHRAELERLKHKEAADKAKDIWINSTLVDDTHPYLVRKGVTAGIAKHSRGALVLPIVSFDNKLASLQFIQPDGSKLLLSGGQKKGNYIPAGGNVTEPSRVIVCEGFATGRTLSELDPKALVLAAIDAGNLEAVAKNARAKWLRLPLVIAGDDDRMTEGNPGRTKAKAAAIASGAAVMFPQWRDDMPLTLSDFNDWHSWIKSNGGAV